MKPFPLSGPEIGLKASVILHVEMTGEQRRLRAAPEVEDLREMPGDILGVAGGQAQLLVGAASLLLETGNSVLVLFVQPIEL